VETWRREYNGSRPHGALGEKMPNEFANEIAASRDLIGLRKKGLSGFGNGVGYGEWRDSSYHRGGTAEARVYIPKLHRFLDPARAQALVDRSGDYFTAELFSSM
jgi:hypothetical protein